MTDHQFARTQKPGLPEYRVDHGEDQWARRFPVDLATLMGKKISPPIESAREIMKKTAGLVSLFARAVALFLGRRPASAVGAFLLLAFPASVRAQPGPLVYVYGRYDLPASNAGTLAASGDFNGDGIPDLVSISYENGSVSVELGQADGSFRDLGVRYPVGVQPVAAAAADFDGDGNVDLAVLNQVCLTDPCPPGLVSILLGNGDGTFRPHVDYPTGPNPNGLVVGDFNGDGHLDLATADAVSRISSGSPGMVSVLLGNGDGTFQSHVDSPAGNGVIGLAAADFNLDGKLDLVVDNHPSFASQTVSLLIGRGDGSFEQPTTLSAGGDPTSLVAADFDGDGNPDLAITTGVGAVAVLRGNGDGTFQPHVDYPGGFGPVRIIATDMNGDGKLDLVISLTTGIPTYGAVSILLGVGDGTFQVRREYATGTFGPLVAGDFNGDGNQDLAIAKGGNTASVLLGSGDGTLEHPTDYGTGNGVAAVATGDFNGDGNLDLVVANSACSCPHGTVSLLLGNGDGTFRPRADFATGEVPIALAIGDFNQDGSLDLAVANSLDGTVSILLGNGDGTFAPQVTFATGRGPSGIIARDFNSDGKLDLAVANVLDNNLSILLGNGDGTFQPHVDYAAGPGAAGITADDFNGDGKLDIAVANTHTPITIRDQGLVSVLLGNGDGTFQTHVDANTASLQPLDVTTGDFDGDGFVDIAVTTALRERGSVSILRGRGDGTFQLSGNPYSTGRFTTPITSGDFNLDGILDLAVVNAGSNSATILRGKADGTFESQGIYGVGVEPSGLATGDFNGDGALDLAVVNQGPNTVSVFLSTVPAPLTPESESRR